MNDRLSSVCWRQQLKIRRSDLDIYLLSYVITLFAQLKLDHTINTEVIKFTLVHYCYCELNMHPLRKSPVQHDCSSISAVGIEASAKEEF